MDEVPCGWANSFQPMDRLAAIAHQENQMSPTVNRPKVVNSSAPVAQCSECMTAQLREYSKAMGTLAATVEEAYDHSATALLHMGLRENDPLACLVPFLLRKAAEEAVALASD